MNSGVTSKRKNYCTHKFRSARVLLQWSHYLIHYMQLLVSDLRLEQCSSVDVSLSRDVILFLQVEASNLKVDVHFEIWAVDPIKLKS